MPARGYGWWTFEQKGRGLIFFYWFSTNYEMTFFLCQVSSNSGLCWGKGDVQRDVCSSEVHADVLSVSLARPLSRITIIDKRRFLYQGLGLHDVCHLELLDKPWLSDPLHLCSGNVSLPFVHHTLTIVIIYEMEISSLINNYCVHLKDNAQKLGLTAVQGSYLVGLIGRCQN